MSKDSDATVCMLSTILEWQQEYQELLKSPQTKIILFSMTLHIWSTIIILTLNPLLLYYIIILHRMPYN